MDDGGYEDGLIPNAPGIMLFFGVILWLIALVGMWIAFVAFPWLLGVAILLFSLWVKWREGWKREV